MPNDRAIEPALNKMIREIPKPDVSVGYFSELVDRSSLRYQKTHPLKRGTLYKDILGADQRVIDAYPILYFVREEVPLGFSDERGIPGSTYVKWMWASVPNAEDSYNAEVKYIADSVANPSFIRQYTIRRDVYDNATPLALGSTLTGLVGVKITAAGTGYTHATGAVATGATVEFVVSAGTLIAGIVTNEGTGVTSGASITITGDGSGATATALVQPATAVLVSQGKVEIPDNDPLSNEFVRIIRTYEVLPGAYVPFTRYDVFLGPIQGRRRPVVNTGQTASLTATTKTTYEGRDGSSYVSLEIEETWSNGTGSAGNPAYPIGTADTYENERGAVQTVTQVVVATGSEVGSLAVSGGVATHIEYQPLEGYQPYLLKKITETWALPGPILSSTEFDRDGIKKVVTRQMMDTDDVVTSEDLTTGVLTHKFKERLNKEIAFQVIETITVDDAALLDDKSFTVSIPNVIPEIFRALLKTRTEGHIVAGTATEPTLGLGEFERSERQLTPLYKEVRFTVLEDIGSLPITFTGIKETDANKQVVTVSLTLELDSTTPSTPTATTDVEFKKLGNGLAVETIRTVPEVFSNDSYTKSILDLIPPKLRAVIPTTESTIDSPGSPSTNPTLLTGELSRTESRLTEYTKRIKIVSLGAISVPVSVSDTQTTKDKQVATVVYTLLTHGTSTAAVSALQDVSVEDLGNGYDVETVTSVPSVFPAGSYTKTIVDLIPPELRAQIPVVDTDVTSAGTASSNPTLLTGELSRNEQQVNVYTKRVRVSSLGSISVPVSVTASETNKDKQVVSILYTLETTGTNAVVPTALIDVAVKDLGNGYEVVTKRTIASVFPANTYSVSVINLIPEQFRAKVPTYESDVTSAGNASVTPALGTGELERSETQVDVFVKRVRVRSVSSVSLPITLTGGQRVVQKYGVQLLADEVITLALAGTLTIPTGFLVIEAEKKEIGGGMEVATSLVASGGSWPTVTGSRFDEEMQVRTPTEEQIVDVGYTPLTGAYFIETKEPVDQWKSRRRRITKQPTAVSPETALESVVFAPFEFPGTIDVIQAPLTNNFLGHRQSRAALVKQLVKTWWVSSPTRPEIPFDEIIADSITLVSLLNLDRVETFHNVLHDAYTAMGTIPQFFPATTPSYTEYFLGNPLTAQLKYTVSISDAGGSYESPPSRYSPGQMIYYNSFGGSVSVSFSVKVLTVDPTYGSIQSFEVLSANGPADPSTLNNPYSAPPTAGGGSAKFNMVPYYDYQRGSAWINTPRVVAASVKPTDIPNLWRVDTRTIVMR
jgi:hypothetical protein